MLSVEASSVVLAKANRLANERSVEIGTVAAELVRPVVEGDLHTGDAAVQHIGRQAR